MRSTALSAAAVVVLGLSAGSAAAAVAEPNDRAGVAASAAGSLVLAAAQCPKGSRYNSKTGRCDPAKGPAAPSGGTIAKPSNPHPPTRAEVPIPRPPPPKPGNLGAEAKSGCKKGERYDSENTLCIPPKGKPYKPRA